MRAAAWHDVECASYAADLGLWRELAEAHGDPVLDLGCGTGRVALDLAARGRAVVAVDSDPDLVAACDERARARGLGVRAEAADIRTLDLGRHFPLAIAPMQVAQLVEGAEGRAAFLKAVHGHLAPGGVLALALADPFEATDAEPGMPASRVPASELLPPLPDMLERDGWVLYSTPVAVRDEGQAVAIDRHRQAVSPAGDLTEEAATIRLDTVSAQEFEREGLEHGYAVLAPRSVAATHDYVGSTVVMLQVRS